jgi:hypothetical protein
MIERLKLSVPRGGELNTLPRLSPERRDRKTLFASGHELDWPTQPARGDCDDRGPLGQSALGAEGAADIAADDSDLTGLDAELGRKSFLIP